jgi:hypothetical protein
MREEEEEEHCLCLNLLQKRFGGILKESEKERVLFWCPLECEE